MCRYPGIDELITKLIEAGFKIGSINSVSYPRIFKPHVLLNPDGPLSKEWRDLARYVAYVVDIYLVFVVVVKSPLFNILCSSWALLSKEELAKAQQEWTTRQANNTLQQLFKERDDQVKQIGETTTVIAYKQ